MNSVKGWWTKAPKHKRVAAVIGVVIVLAMLVEWVF